MKCDNCNKDVWIDMHYCPYCSYDLTNQFSKYKKVTDKIVTFFRKKKLGDFLF